MQKNKGNDMPVYDKIIRKIKTKKDMENYNNELIEKRKKSLETLVSSIESEKKHVEELEDSKYNLLDEIEFLENHENLIGHYFKVESENEDKKFVLYFIPYDIKYNCEDFYIYSDYFEEVYKNNELYHLTYGIRNDDHVIIDDKNICTDETNYEIQQMVQISYGDFRDARYKSFYDFIPEHLCKYLKEYSKSVNDSLKEYSKIVSGRKDVKSN